MGTALILNGFTTSIDPATLEGDDGIARRRRINAIAVDLIDAMPDVAFHSHRLYLDAEEKDIEVIRDRAKQGVAEYVEAIYGHRMAVWWQAASDRWFVVAGGDTWGDDPYEGWSSLNEFCEWLDKGGHDLTVLADRIGFVAYGLAVDS
jgi:hypothetical protein